MDPDQLNRLLTTIGDASTATRDTIRDFAAAAAADREAAPLQTFKREVQKAKKESKKVDPIYHRSAGWLDTRQQHPTLGMQAVYKVLQSNDGKKKK